jgi:V/A-type H+/Na+-transporting ATPase subunit I
MAIVPVAKVTLYGTADQKEAVIAGLQEMGCLHLLDLSQSCNERPGRQHFSPDAVQALKYLQDCPTQRRAVKDGLDFQFDDVVDQALSLEQQQQQLQAERDELKQSIAALIPWGDFQLPTESEFGGLSFWFYVIPHYRLSSLEDFTATWHVVASDNRFAYVIVLSLDEPIGMPVLRTDLDDRSLSELQRRFEAIETQLEKLHWQRVRLTRWIHQLSRTKGFAEDRAARERAAGQAFNDPSMFAIQGWAPQSMSEQIRAFARERELGVTIEQPTAEDSPPTLLSNRGFATGGEDAVTFYTTPAYRAWDPSGVVFLSFSLFFAMIMADAGYAMLLSILLLLFWRRLGESPSTLRLRKLFVAIAVTSIAYGVAVGSYFGFPPPTGSLVDKLHFIDASNTTLMMQLSIAVGVIHLSIANLALAWSRRWSPMMLSSVGWVAALVGGLALGLGKSGTQPEQSLIQFGSWALGIGLVGVLLFSSQQPIFTLSAKDHGIRFIDGVLSLANISRAFGDVLSYLRLFALGLASAQLAATFNDLTYKASCCVGIGGLLAIVAVILGHGLNFVLAIMSGVVHGLRLNCIEFFGWSLPDEGYPFQPFCRKAS